MLPVLGLDADDTLWENEERFHEVEQRFRDLMTPWANSDATDAALLATERINIARHGYGIKGFVLSMVVTAVEISDGAIDAWSLANIVDWGHQMMAHPIELLSGVTEALDVLGSTHRLLLITKGDPVDQLDKVQRRGLAERFWRVEVLPEKNPDTYRKILAHHQIDPVDFTMVGNSVKSDVLPVLAIGGRAFHVPHTTTWVLEEPDPAELASVDFLVVEELSQVAELLSN